MIHALAARAFYPDCRCLSSSEADRHLGLGSLAVIADYAGHKKIK